MGDSGHSSTCHYAKHGIMARTDAKCSIQSPNLDARMGPSKISIISMYDNQNVEIIATSTSGKRDVDSKQFHATRTRIVLKDLLQGCLRFVFTKVVNDPQSFIHVDNIIGISGFQP